MPEMLRVRPWPDPVIDTLGHDPRSRYVEVFYLPTLGPTALLFLRFVAQRFDELPLPAGDGDDSGGAGDGGLDLPVAATAQALGLGPREGRNSPLFRTVSRLVEFDLAIVDRDATIAVRRNLPPLSRRHLQRLPDDLRLAHDRWLEHSESPRERGERRARRLALTMVELGTDVDVVEQALGRLGFPPIPSRAAAVWARAAHQAMEREVSPAEEAA